MKRKIQYLGSMLAVVFLVLTFCVFKAQAQSADPKALVAMLKSGGYVVVLRHGDTNHDQTDVQPPDYGNVMKQRRLSDKGRQTATQIGDAVKKQGIMFGKIDTSLLDRGIETGKLVSGGEVTSTIDLTENSAAVDPAEKDRRAKALLMMTGVMPEPGKNTLLVTHKPNIIGAFGKPVEDISEGEAVIFKPDGKGNGAMVGRLKEADWSGAVN